MKRLLFISHCVPYPPDKGERIRAYHELQALQPEFAVTLICLARSRHDAAAAERLSGLCEEIIVARSGGKRGLLRGAIRQLAGGSVTEGFLHNGRLVKLMTQRWPAGYFDLALGYSSGVLPYLLAAPARAKVMDLVDVDSAKWHQYAQRARWPWRGLYRRESRRVAQLEARAGRQCDAVVCVSHSEAAEAGEIASKLQVVPNGVDSGFFSPGRGSGKLAALVFVGSMDYRPNIEAVNWFASYVWPELKSDFPELEFKIVGRDPTREVLRLAQLPGIKVTGAVPDVRPYLSTARVAVAPLQIARGVQNKVLEAMAMARPVVATSAALEGLEVTAGVDVVRADTVTEWRTEIGDLLTNGQRRSHLGRAARHTVRNRYDWPTCLAPLVSLCRQLCPADRAEPMTTPIGSSDDSRPDHSVFCQRL